MEDGLAPSSKKEIRSPQYRRYPQNLKSSQSLATRHKKDWALLSPLYKKYFRVGGVYTIENKGTNTGYQKVIGSRNQKWEIVEITTCIIFFAWDLYSLFLYKEFSSHTWKKSPQSKVPIPTQIPIWPTSLLYKPVNLKNDSAMNDKLANDSQQLDLC